MANSLGASEDQLAGMHPEKQTVSTRTLSDLLSCKVKTTQSPIYTCKGAWIAEFDETTGTLLHWRAYTHDDQEE